MNRLLDLLAPLEGKTGAEATFEASFRLDGEHRPLVRIEVRAELPLVCQASLEVYLESVQRLSELAVVASDAQESSVPEGYEPVTAEHGRLALLTLVEDELLLGLPQVPRRPELDTVGYTIKAPGVAEPAGAQSEGDGLRKPFASLGRLLDEKHRNKN